MRGCILSTILTIMGAALVLLVIAFLSQILFDHVPWYVSSEEGKELILVNPILTQAVPGFKAVRVEIVPELTANHAVTNSLLLILTTATICAAVIVGIPMNIAFALAASGPSGLGDALINAVVNGVIGMLFAFFMPVLIWFGLFFQQGDLAYMIVWGVAGSIALSLGYAAVSYGTYQIYRLSRFLASILKTTVLFTSRRWQLGCVGIVIVVLVGVYFIAPQIGGCQPMLYNQVVEGHLDQATTATYCFYGNAGDVAAIRVFIPDGDVNPVTYPQITLAGPDKQILASDAQNNNRVFAYLQQALTESGFYQVTVRSIGQPRPYRMRIEQGERAAMGDINRDCTVDETDFELIQQRFDTTGNDDLDIDLSGHIDSEDHDFARRDRGQRCR
ncbi:MAG: hypothetical protein HC837_06215 [Chloroflexaceae bacterium]|nr:hypothetical protein [Chloroflexaceae bacterium]